ncbi:hypothetical protein CHCC14814_4449 [Bacillus paralicheniformis]|nr:hypothetical protein CHCC14814_4449 [Bacillus paralicheniformis]
MMMALCSFTYRNPPTSFAFTPFGSFCTLLKKMTFVTRFS